MSPYSKPELTYLQSQRRLGRLATVGPDGTPHVTPVSAWTVDPASAVIEMADRWNFTATKKFRDAARTARHHRHRRGAGALTVTDGGDQRPR